MVEGRRFIGPLIILPALALIVFGELSITPKGYFSSPWYWVGGSLFTFIGAFLYGTPKESSKLPRYGGIAFILILSAALGLSQRYPDALAFGFGFVGLFVGLFLRGFYVGFIQSRWAYCPGCNRKVWQTRKKGRWYCEKQGHEVEPTRT